MASAYESDVPATTPQLPQIPECHVVRAEDGRIHLTHKGTGQTAVARDDEEDPVIQGAILRTHAAWEPQLRRIQPPWSRPEPEFRVGDLP
ncbi:hypothetical protein E1286_05400 [Nonomuraea terrae]|uniref:Uncharacterized protein n=1 Tax=Nonomuraea terrae TaxID=2530383 RepID=A0A4R4Z8W1_9ACTN|nr:hypothetical protein [Nonomuraea terrae]TDD54625.1 hypothetical protein E1286_05400 [Nonomuraea terrae]